MPEIYRNALNDIANQTEIPNSRNHSTDTFYNATGIINETTSELITETPFLTQRAEKRDRNDEDNLGGYLGLKLVKQDARETKMKELSLNNSSSIAE